MPSSSPQQPPFHNYPSKYARSFKKAARFWQQVHTLTQKGPRSLIGTVVDTSFHLTQGYVLCQTHSGIVRVVGVPFGSVVPQMRVFCRQLGSHATNKAYVFDGYAPSLAQLGPDSGLLLASSPTGDSGSALATTTTGGVPTVSTLPSAIGYYWHLFFYLPQVPTARVTLLEMVPTSGSYTVALEMLPTGQLVFRSVSNNTGLTTTKPVAPHQLHWLQLQPGLTGADFLLDGALVPYTGNPPFFNGGGTFQTLSLLANLDGSQVAPLGSWVSKIGFGACATIANGVVIPAALSTGVSVPEKDSQVPNFNSSATSKTLALYLCEDGAGATHLANSAVGSVSTSALSVASPYGSVLATGPY